MWGGSGREGPAESVGRTFCGCDSFQVKFAYVFCAGLEKSSLHIVIVVSLHLLCCQKELCCFYVCIPPISAGPFKSFIRLLVLRCCVGINRKEPERTGKNTLNDGMFG